LDLSSNYLGILPAGNYLVEIGAAPILSSPLQFESLQIYNFGSLVVGGVPATGNFTIPTASILSGTVSISGLAAIPSGTTLTASDTSAAQPAQPVCCPAPGDSNAIPGPSGKYEMILQQGRSFAISATVPISQAGDVVTYTPTPGTVSMGGNTTLDVNIPAVRRGAVIYGNISDGLGHNLADDEVTASSQNLSGLPNTSYTISGKTDIYGNYSITVASGTKYTLTFTPPAPRP
jgi:hypothetical protein